MLMKLNIIKMYTQNTICLVSIYDCCIACLYVGSNKFSYLKYVGSAILLGTEQPIITSYVIMSSLSGWKAGTKLLSINFKSTGQYFRFFSTGHARSSPSLNVNPQELIEVKGDAFYDVRKGNHVGPYLSLNDCQSQVSSLIICIAM